VITPEDYAWLTDPGNTSGCPALYECRMCQSVFRWFRTDGETGPFCDKCAKIIHDRHRPREIASMDKWSLKLPTSAAKVPEVVNAMVLRADAV
jgi:hypothetical protein